VILTAHYFFSTLEVTWTHPLVPGCLRSHQPWCPHSPLQWLFILYSQLSLSHIPAPVVPTSVPVLPPPVLQLHFIHHSFETVPEWFLKHGHSRSLTGKTSCLVLLLCWNACSTHFLKFKYWSWLFLFLMLILFDLYNCTACKSAEQHSTAYSIELLYHWPTTQCLVVSV